MHSFLGMFSFWPLYLRCDCTEKLQSRFEFLRSQLNDISSFKNIYRYAFDFARDKDQRSLDIDTAKSMLALLLGRTWPLFSVFYQYLEQSKYRVMNKDQWYNVLEFSRTVHADLSNYDEDGACKYIMNSYENKNIKWDYAFYSINRKFELVWEQPFS